MTYLITLRDSSFRKGKINVWIFSLPTDFNNRVGSQTFTKDNQDTFSFQYHYEFMDLTIFDMFQSNAFIIRIED